VVDHLLILKISKRLPRDFRNRHSCQKNNRPNVFGKALTFMTTSINFLEALHAKKMVAVAWSIHTTEISETQFKNGPMKIQHLYCATFEGEKIPSCDSKPDMLDPVVLEAKPETIADTALDYYYLGANLYYILHCERAPFQADRDVERIKNKKEGKYTIDKEVPTILAFVIAWLLQDDRRSRSNLPILKLLNTDSSVPEYNLPLKVPLDLSTHDDPRTVPEFKALVEALGPKLFEQQKSEGPIVGDVQSEEWSLKRAWKDHMWLVLGCSVGFLFILIALLMLLIKKEDTPEREDGQGDSREQPLGETVIEVKDQETIS